MAEAPLSAEEIVHRGFPSTFRGFDPAEVRAYLLRVAGELKAAHGREHELKQKLSDAERRAANPVIDQDMLTKALGEETSRVLASAQEAARQLQARAEDGVAKILREAHEQAQQIRVAAEVVLADRTEEADAAAAQIRGAAQAEAAALLEKARGEAEAARAEVVEEARQLVHEAQAARARVLGDLARRRRIAHTQVEQLRAGRERLLEAYRVVRRTLDEVADELERVEPEARMAAGAAARRVEAALEAGEDPAEDPGDVASTGAGAEASAMAAAPLPEAASSVPASPIEAAPAPTTSAVEGKPSGERPATAPGAEPEPAPLAERSTRPVVAWAGPTAVPPIVAREERAEERKLSSLRILRRPKADDAPAAELEALEVPFPVEAVRVIPAEAGPATRPPPVPGSPRTDREQPSVMPGVSWAPSPPAEVASPAAALLPASTPPPGSTAPATPPPASLAPATSSPKPERPSPVPDGGSPASVPVAVDLAAVPEVPPAADVQDHQSSGAEPASPVEALFARIRADRAGAAAPPAGAAPAAATSVPPDEAPSLSDGVARFLDVPVEPLEKELGEPGPVEAQPGREESLLQQRDEALETIEAALARKLKRALQDEHNDVLDRLRSCKGPPSTPAFLPTPADQAVRYADAASELLAQAARSGVQFAAPGVVEVAAPEVADVVADLTEALVGPLRRGVERGLESGQEDTSVLADTIGAAYRECKTQRLERLAGDATIAAFSRGTVSATAGADLRWVVDDGDAACPDCDDNALAGPTPSGQQYPTGQSHPPAHAGCRCLLVPGRP